MSEYGVKIKNIEASTLYMYNKGLRNQYASKDAMLSNSLLLDFLLENGLNVKNGCTRDVICLEFNFGTRTFEEEIAHLEKTAERAKIEYKIAKGGVNKSKIESKANKRKCIANCIQFAKEHEEEYKKISKEELREIMYCDGVTIEYVGYKKNGDVKNRETIHYKMLYRSTGKAKKGSVTFIREELYDKTVDFLRMGIKLPETNAPIVEISAYMGLVASGCVGKVNINPRSVLILKDIDRFMTRNIVSVETDENKICTTKRIDNYELCNTLFDGQALIDSSLMPDWANGFILLRQHFFKAAAFNTNIQMFFRDYFGDKYETATVTDMFGIEHNVKDIQMITTDNAVKWVKFKDYLGGSLRSAYEYWCEKVEADNCNFGIVKTDHESKLGDVQRTSYQMVNSLDESIMPNVCQQTIDYVTKLKTDDEAFDKYLEKNMNFCNDFDVLLALCKQNPEFRRSEYYRNRKRKIIEAYMLNVRSGRLLLNADNLVIVGSPYAMLLYGATNDESIVDTDTTFSIEGGTTQCFTTRFDDGEYLAEFRSPFNGRYNLGYLHNVYSMEMLKYFNFSKQIIAVNCIGTDICDRNNGLITGSVQ